jgi:hypothetical protein
LVAQPVGLAAQVGGAVQRAGATGGGGGAGAGAGAGEGDRAWCA